MIATATDPAIRLRIPKPLKERVEKAASRTGRSVNTLILEHIRSGLKAKQK